MFRNRRIVIAVATNKQKHNVQYVTSYSLKYLDDSNTWRNLTDKTGNNVVSCDWNYNLYLTRTCELPDRQMPDIAPVRRLFHDDVTMKWPVKWLLDCDVTIE